MITLLAIGIVTLIALGLYLAARWGNFEIPLNTPNPPPIYPKGYGPQETCKECGYPLHGNETCPNMHNQCMVAQNQKWERQVEELKQTERMKVMAHMVADIILERMGKS